jgi:hypothetical protein
MLLEFFTYDKWLSLVTLCGRWGDIFQEVEYKLLIEEEKIILEKGGNLF